MNYAANEIYKESEQKVIKEKSRSKTKAKELNDYDESFKSELIKL